MFEDGKRNCTLFITTVVAAFVTNKLFELVELIVITVRVRLVTMEQAVVTPFTRQDVLGSNALDCVTC